MTEQNLNKSQTPTTDDEIDLIALVKTIWEGRKIVIKTTLIFMVIGLFVAIFSEKEYTASTTFISQTGESKVGGSLGGLAAMAGINIGGSNSDSGISPSLYYIITQSIPFQKELLQTPLTIEGYHDKVTFENYYTEIYSPGFFGYLKKYSIGLPGLIIGALKEKTEVVKFKGDQYGRSSLLLISRKEKELFKRLSAQISLELYDKDGYITIVSSMPEATAAAELTQRVQELLQKFIINFKTQKSKEQLVFIKSRYAEVELKFKKKQQNFAIYRDRNKNIVTALGQTKLELLEDEYNLVYGVYSELAKQLESKYIQVTEDTPVFTILKPVTIPLDKTKPKRGMILIIWTFVGSFIGIAFVSLKEFRYFKK